MKKKILIVDDDRESSESLRLALTGAGYDVILGHDGTQGLVLAEKERPDLVLLDMMMPKRNGLLVLETLRQLDPCPVRVIMITANEGLRHKQYAERLGVDDYLRKPFSIDVLLASVARLLSPKPDAGE